MPELPEVETLCRQLQKKIAGKKISATKVYDTKLDHVKNLKGRPVTAVRRKGKMLEIILDDANSIFVHLRMTGRLLWQEEADRPKHCRWWLSFVDGNLYLVDPRRFATIKVLKTENAADKNDILCDFDQKAFIVKHGRRKTNVKNLIMDQNAIAGIGNIYACEILHSTGIHPERHAASLNNNDWKKIFKQAKIILSKAIDNRGTSISDWRDLYGDKGENQYKLKVYGQEGRLCANCGSTILRIKQGGRSTFYCPHCQK